MRYAKYLLNLPWSVLAIIGALISLPVRISSGRDAVIIKVRSLKWLSPQRGVRAVTLGNVVLLGDTKSGDLEHELVHIEQAMRCPLLHPVLAIIERLRHGSKNSKYEKEAYLRAGNDYVSK